MKDPREGGKAGRDVDKERENRGWRGKDMKKKRKKRTGNEEGGIGEKERENGK